MAESGVELRVLAGEFKPALERYFSRRVDNVDEVQDLVHDTFVRLLRQQRHVELDMVRGYVFQTANSVLVDWLRRTSTRNEAQAISAGPETPDDLNAPERILAGREQLAEVANVLMELPPRTRAIFLMRRLDGMKYEEIAERLGLSLSSVEKLMRRALMHLTDRLEERR
jgi:RNA polymerase sigma factor (sigma-70 family)